MGDEQLYPPGTGGAAAALQATEAQLKTAWVLAGAGSSLLQPRAKY